MEKRLRLLFWPGRYLYMEKRLTLLFWPDYRTAKPCDNTFIARPAIFKTFEKGYFQAFWRAVLGHNKQYYT